MMLKIFSRTRSRTTRNTIPGKNIAAGLVIFLVYDPCVSLFLIYTYIKYQMNRKEKIMINFELNDDEAKLVSDVLGNYRLHLGAEIMHTDSREFREALKKREKDLEVMIERLGRLVK